MEKFETAEAAFDNFMENVFPLAFPPGERQGVAYNRVRQATYARRGKGKRKLTKSWVAKIIQDYEHLVPGRYRIEQVTEIYVQPK
jgi:hypothetical protein